MTNEITVVGSKSYKKCKVVMLPSMEMAPNPIDPSILHITKLQRIYFGGSGQHLYFISNEEIKQDDWCLWGHRMVKKFESSNHNSLMWAKIIATTDPALNLPRPSQSFLEAYCRQNGIDEVLIEVEKCCYVGLGGCLCSAKRCEMLSTCLKVAEDNTITIKPVQETTYTFKEMVEFVMWYSGMSQEKVVNAYNRYLVEKP